MAVAPSAGRPAGFVLSRAFFLPIFPYHAFTLDIAFIVLLLGRKIQKQCSRRKVFEIIAGGGAPGQMNLEGHGGMSSPIIFLAG
jgi:hypothetical protein